MYTEIKECTYVLTSFLMKRCPRTKIAWFAESFANSFLARVVNHMVDPSLAMDGEVDQRGFWVICDKKTNYLCPLAIQASTEVALGVGELYTYLPEHLAFKIKIGEVHMRVNTSTKLLWKASGKHNGYSPIPWSVMQQSIAERTIPVMCMSYDQKIRSDFIPLELVPPSRLGYVFPIHCKESDQIDTSQIFMFRSAGPARYLITTRDFAMTRFGNRRRRTRNVETANSRRVYMDVVPYVEHTHFFCDNWWNGFLSSEYFMDALGDHQYSLQQYISRMPPNLRFVY